MRPLSHSLGSSAPTPPRQVLSPRTQLASTRNLTSPHLPVLWAETLGRRLSSRKSGRHPKAPSPPLGPEEPSAAHDDMQVISRHKRMFSSSPTPPPPPVFLPPENTNRILIALRSKYRLRLRPDDHLFVAISKLLNGELFRRKAIPRDENAVSVWDDKIVITTSRRMDVDFMLWAVGETEAMFKDGWRVTGMARDPSDGSLL